MNTVLFAFDGSENALRALKEAVAPFTPEKLHVRLLNVQEPVRMREVVIKDTLSGMQAIEAEREMIGQQALEPAKQVLQQAGILFNADVRIGSPAQTIVQFARENHCSMIAMGARGMGTVKNMLLGSVSNAVIHLADLPVLVVK